MSALTGILDQLRKLGRSELADTLERPAAAVRNSPDFVSIEHDGTPIAVSLSLRGPGVAVTVPFGTYSLRKASIVRDITGAHIVIEFDDPSGLSTGDADAIRRLAS